MEANLITAHGEGFPVTSAHMGAMQAGAFGPDAYILSGCVASMPSANSLHVSAGYLMVQGRLVEIPGGVAVVENGSQGMRRHALACIEYARDPVTAFEDASVIVLEGVPGVVGTDPDYDDRSILDGSPGAQVPIWRVRLDGLTPTVEEVAERVPSLDAFAPASVNGWTVIRIGSAAICTRHEVDALFTDGNDHVRMWETSLPLTFASPPVVAMTKRDTAHSSESVALIPNVEEVTATTVKVSYEKAGGGLSDVVKVPFELTVTGVAAS